jgi:hypothetical protein
MLPTPQDGGSHKALSNPNTYGLISISSQQQSHTKNYNGRQFLTLVVLECGDCDALFLAVSSRNHGNESSRHTPGDMR